MSIEKRIYDAPGIELHHYKYNTYYIILLISKYLIYIY